MTVTRSCPKCGASLSAEDGTLTCRYCGAEILATPRPLQPLAAPAPKSHALLYAALGVPAVVLGVLALVVLVRQGDAPPPPPPTVMQPPSALPKEAPSAAPAPPASSAPPGADLAEVAFEFGEEGKGPGQLDKSMHLAVDGNGDIYVASRDSRRIQHFDPAGKFVDAFELAEGKQDNLVQGLATTYDGHLWATRGGDLVKLALPGGKVVTTIPNQKPRVSYQGVIVDSTNKLYATNIGALTFISTDGRLPQSDNVRKLDKNGNLIAAWKDIGGNTGGSLAVDAQGTLYIAERRSPFIDIIDPSGKVKARFSGPHGYDGGIVVDGKGRILTGGRGINVYDGTGTKTGQIGNDTIGAIALGPKGRLYALVEKGPIRVLTLR